MGSGEGHGVDRGPTLAVTALDGQAAPHASRSPQTAPEVEGPFTTSLLSRTTPSPCPHSSDGVPSFRESLRLRGIQAAGADVLMASWRPSTGKQYQSHLRRWASFCGGRDINPFSPTVTDVINFLTVSFTRGVGYSSINTSRGALSSLGIMLEGVSAGAICLWSGF